MSTSAPSPITAASPWRRIGAYFVDYFVFILPLLGIVSLVSWGLSYLNISPFSDNAWLNQGIVFLVLTMPVVFYFASCEASRYQATLGKRLVNVSVVDTSGHAARCRRT